MNLFHPNGALVMPYCGREVPHAVIEVNQKCNISCRACYKSKMNYTKPLTVIKQEIDFVATQRHLHIITLAGGEPTLHPDLPEIIKYIADKGILPQVLSNGFALKEEMLSAYKKAGLFAIFLHVDSMQQRADAPLARSEKDFNPLRKAIVERITHHGIHCSLEVTCYRETMTELRDVIDFLFCTPQCRNILVTCFGDHDAIFRRFRQGTVLGSTMKNGAALEKEAQAPTPCDSKVLKNKEVKEMLAAQGMHPYAYVGSSHSPWDERWMFYYTFVIQNKDGSDPRFLHIDPSFGKLVGMTYRKAHKLGRPYAFGMQLSRRRRIFVCILSALCSLNLRQMARTARFLAALWNKEREIYEKTVNIQEFPSVNEGGELVYCRECPDATVRDGKLVPVCMVDLLSPLTTTS